MMALELTAGHTQPHFLVDELTRMMADVALLTGTTDSFAPIPGLDPRSPTLAVSRARILLATGDLRGAQDLATKVTERGRCAAIADLVALIEAWLVRALAADQAGCARDASAALRRAVEIASPHRLVRPFLVTGSAQAPVLLRRLADGRVDHDPFLADLRKRTSIRAPSAPEPTPLLEPLTGRELAVLAELPTMKSNAEIAAEYFVSVNTVKSHLKGIYHKLDVNSRRAAVRRARELDLLA